MHSSIFIDDYIPILNLKIGLWASFEFFTKHADAYYMTIRQDIQSQDLKFVSMLNLSIICVNARLYLVQLYLKKLRYDYILFLVVKTQCKRRKSSPFIEVLQEMLLYKVEKWSSLTNPQIITVSTKRQCLYISFIES